MKTKVIKTLAVDCFGVLILLVHVYRMMIQISTWT
jgi:hypothetical protein